MIDDSVTRPSRRRIELMRLSATAVTARCAGTACVPADRPALVRLHLTVAAVLIPALGRTLATHRRTRPAEPSPPATASTEKAAR